MDSLLVQTAVTDISLEWGFFLLAVCLRTDKFWFMAGSVAGILTLQSLFTTGTYFPRQVPTIGQRPCLLLGIMLDRYSDRSRV